MLVSRAAVIPRTCVIRFSASAADAVAAQCVLLVLSPMINPLDKLMAHPGSRKRERGNRPSEIE